MAKKFQNVTENKIITPMDTSNWTDDLVYDKVDTGFCQFTVEDANYFPCKKTVVNIPSGFYRIRKDFQRGIFFTQQGIITNKLVTLETCEIHKDIMEDISKFWDSKEEYRKRGRAYKRNILIHSVPGMGKTSLINLVVKDLISNHNGFVLSISDNNDIFNFVEAMSYIRSAMPERPVIAIIEDIDNFAGENAQNRELETELLNILDGIQQYDNIVILATTNYPETLTERYINRPSRFNRSIEYPYPSADVRREFIVKTNLKEDIAKIDLEKWVKKTDGFTTDHLKELCDSVFLYGYTEDKTFETIQKMKDTKILKNKSGSEKKKVGFKVRKTNCNEDESI